MRRAEREVKDIIFIDAMLHQMQILNLGMNDEDGIPYVVPTNFGHEFTNDQLIVYTHGVKVGKKVELIEKDNRVC